MPEINSLLVWIILGGLSGWIASMLVKKNTGMGVIGNILVGIVGAFIGGWIAGALGLTGVTGLNLTSFIVAIVGSIVLLTILNLIGRKA